MRDEIVDLNGSGTFTRKQYKEQHGLSETSVTRVLKGLLDAGTIIKVATGAYRYVPGVKVSPAVDCAFTVDMTVDVPASTLDDVMAAMDLGWLEGKAIELIAHHDSIADVEQAIGCLKSILRHQYGG
jgi:hypothetical protein